MSDLAVEVTRHGPPLVPVHAAIGDRRRCDPVVEGQGDRRWIVRYDVGGLGASPDPAAVGPHVPGAGHLAAVERPGAVGRHVPGAGHLAAVERPAAVAATIAGRLDGVGWS